jgi:hypothetical protein
MTYPADACCMANCGHYIVRGHAWRFVEVEDTG